MTRTARSSPEATVGTDAAADLGAPVTGPRSVATIVDRFTQAWASAESPPVLADYLPDSAAVRRVALIELIKVDLANRWERRIDQKRLTDYCTELPELTDWPLPPDLIYEEFHIRRRCGESVDVVKYAGEFAEQAGAISQLLETGDYESTSLHQPRMARSGEPTALTDVEVGMRIDDFDLIAELGRGAFARVFLARQRSMQRLVAVKISPDQGTEPQTLAQLDHDFIVRVFDQRVLSARRLRLLYMQYVPGGTLLSVVKRVRETVAGERSGTLLIDVVDAALAEKGEIRPAESATREALAALSWPETVVWLGSRLAGALDYAGRRGVQHRDVKPANVLLTAEGAPKLADFNISFSGNVSGASPVAYFGGSLAYMSPEQLEAVHPDRDVTALDLDTRSDLYSLAVVLWELLTGRKPFDDEVTDSGAGDTTTLDAMLDRRRRGVQEPDRDVPPDCPAALRRVLLRALAPDPADRWASGAEFAQQLDVCLDPRARDLVDPPERSWRLRLRTWIHPIMAVAIAVPNLLAIWYSYHHNQRLIVDTLDPQVQQRFEQFTVTSYAVAFAIGTVFTVWMTWNVFAVAMGLRRGKSYDAASLMRARSATLLLGQRVGWFCFGLWAVTGIGVPLTLQLAGSPISWSAYVHFVAAQLVCGAIAVVYPFFVVNFYAVRSVYPMFIPQGHLDAEDARMLRSLDRRNTMYLAAAAAIPLFGVAGATFVPPTDLPQVVVAVRVLCVGSAFAFLGAYWLFRLLEQDVHALERVVAAGAPD